MDPGHTQARGGQPEALTALKEAGGDLLAKNKFGSTPLHAAAHWGSPECTKLLLEWLDKESIETTNAFGWTALCAALPRCLCDAGVWPKFSIFGPMFIVSETHPIRFEL